MKKLGLALAAAAAIGLFAGGAVASSHNTGPSSKATFTYADINVMDQIDIDTLDVYVEDQSLEEALFDGGAFDDDCSQTEFDTDLCILGNVLDAFAQSKWAVLSTTIKMPKHKDISIDVSMECGNFLDTTVKSKGGNKDSASAAATVRVAVMVDDGVNTPSFAFPSGSSQSALALTADGNADENDDTLLTQGITKGVVFCHKSQLLEAVFQGLIQEGDPENLWLLDTENSEGSDDGLEGTTWLGQDACELAGDATEEDRNECTDTEVQAVGTCLIQLENGSIVLLTDCLTPEELRLATGSMTASAFNFLYHNAKESSVHTITVLAWVDTGAALGGVEALGKASAKATIGMGSMMVETVRLVKQNDAALMSGPAEECNVDNLAACVALE